MLSNSFEFIFVFLALALIGYLVAARVYGNTAQLSWIIAASCIFYAYWDPIYILLLIGSLLANFLLGQQLMRNTDTSWCLLAGSRSIFRCSPTSNIAASFLPILPHWRSFM